MFESEKLNDSNPCRSTIVSDNNVSSLWENIHSLETLEKTVLDDELSFFINNLKLLNNGKQAIKTGKIRKKKYACLNQFKMM